MRMLAVAKGVDFKHSEYGNLSIGDAILKSSLKGIS